MILIYDFLYFKFLSLLATPKATSIQSLFTLNQVSLYLWWIKPELKHQLTKIKYYDQVYRTNEAFFAKKIFFKRFVYIKRASYLLWLKPVPDFGVSTAIMLFSRNYLQVVQVGLWTLARKRWIVRQNIRTTSLLSNFLAYNNFKSTEKRITFDVEVKVFKIYYFFLNHI